MKNLFILLFVIISFSNIKVYASEFPEDYCHCDDTSSDFIYNKCIGENLNSDFEFKFNSRVIGIDNENFKFYEILYNNEVYEEKLLSYDDVQKIFSDVDVIKISDFKRGTYTILSNNEEKVILIYNDTNSCFKEYSIKLENIQTENSQIKSLIKLPKRGKVLISNIKSNKDKTYIIKVR